MLKNKRKQMLPVFTSSTINVRFSLLHEINHVPLLTAIQCKSIQRLVDCNVCFSGTLLMWPKCK